MIEKKTGVSFTPAALPERGGRNWQKIVEEVERLDRGEWFEVGFEGSLNSFRSIFGQKVRNSGLMITTRVVGERLFVMRK